MKENTSMPASKKSIPKVTLRKNADGSTSKVLIKKVQRKIKLKVKAPATTEIFVEKVADVGTSKVPAKVVKTTKEKVIGEEAAKATTETTSTDSMKRVSISKGSGGGKIIIRKKPASERVVRPKGEFNFKKTGSFPKKQGHSSGNYRWRSNEPRESLSKIKGYNLGEVERDPLENVPKTIEIPEIISIRDLSVKLNLKATQVIKKLFSLGVRDLTVNDNVDSESAQIVCNEFGCEVKISSLLEETKVELEEGKEEDYVTRDPIVTVMGHVDHGKTTLLDTIRKVRTVDREVGGITQHVGAYKVKTKKGSVLFIDTPGHEAFSSMRARGAQITDLIILVVSAVDGVKPQTIEAIKHAKEGNVPIMVAINKMDVSGAASEKIKSQLMEYELVPENLGGDTVYHEISALNNTGVDTLLESVALQSEVLELKGNPKIRAYGYIVESKMEVGKGNTISVVVKNGTLKTSDAYICGRSFGKVRAFFDENGKQVKKAGPSEVVQIIGLTHLTPPGEVFQCIESEKEAKKIVEKRENLEQENKATRVKKVTLSNLDAILKEQSLKEYRVILKTDTFGSLEAIKYSLEKLKNEQIKVEIIHEAVGPIGESDINLAMTSDSVIIAFKVRANSKVTKLANRDDVKIKNYDVIYAIIDDIVDSLSDKMDNEVKEHQMGVAEVKDLFKVTKVGKIAGCEVVEGKITNKDQIRLVRDQKVIYKGELESLFRFKDAVKEVGVGMECGLSIKNYQDIKVGDRIETFHEETIETSFQTD